MQNKNLLKMRRFLFVASFFLLSPQIASADGIDVNNMPYQPGQTTGICEIFGGQCDWDGDNNGCVTDPTRSIRVGYCDGTFNNAGCCVSTPAEQQAFRDRVAAYNAIENREFPDNGIQCSDPLDQGGPGGQCNAVSYICSEGQRAIGYCDGAGPDFIDIDPACCVPEENFDQSNGNVTRTEQGNGLFNTDFRNGLNYTPLENIPFITTNGNFSEFIQGLFVFILVMTTIAAIFMLTVGGFMYLTSAGNTSRIGSAKRTITDALIGLVLAFFAWLILNIINPDLVNLSINALSPVPVEVPAGSNVPGGGGAAGPSGGTGQLPTLGAQQAAQRLLDSSRVSFPYRSRCNNNDDADDNLRQVASGQGARRCDGQTVALNQNLLNALVAYAEAGNGFGINTLAGARHSSNSRHYQGRAADIAPSTPKSSWNATIAFFTSLGGNAFCDRGGVSVRCTQASHVHVSF